MLVVYRITIYFRGGFIYKHVDVIAVRVFYIWTITFYQDQQYT